MFALPWWKTVFSHIYVYKRYNVFLEFSRVCGDGGVIENIRERLNLSLPGYPHTTTGGFVVSSMNPPVVHHVQPLSARYVQLEENLDNLSSKDYMDHTMFIQTP